MTTKRHILQRLQFAQLRNRLADQIRHFHPQLRKTLLQNLALWHLAGHAVSEQSDVRSSRRKNDSMCSDSNVVTALDAENPQ